MFDSWVGDEESDFAKDYLQRIRNRDFEYVYRYVDSSIANEVSDELLEEVAAHFPSGEVLSVETIGKTVVVHGDSVHANLTFEYQFSGGWAIGNVVLIKTGEDPRVIGFRVYRTGASQKEINRITFAGKSNAHYAMFVLAIAVPLFIIASLIYCIRTPMARRKWLWIIFIVLGFGTLKLNWTTGQTDFQPISIQLMGTSVRAASPHAPWIVGVSWPLGAIAFWLKRKSLIARSRERDAAATSADAEPEGADE